MINMKLQRKLMDRCSYPAIVMNHQRLIEFLVACGCTHVPSPLFLLVLLLLAFLHRCTNENLNFVRSTWICQKSLRKWRRRMHTWWGEVNLEGDLLFGGDEETGKEGKRIIDLRKMSRSGRRSLSEEQNLRSSSILLSASNFPPRSLSLSDFRVP